MAGRFSQDDESIVVIVGSGAGGGTLGNELAQKGIKVVILEAGARHEYDDFINDEWASFTQLAWRDASFTHRKTGVYATMFVAAAIATAFVER